MGSKMLIDAAHPEETRVVVVRNKRVEDFDYESATRKQLRGNIYLAKVTRVEPSLQAAFVDYGGNRHGFLAFSEIHPDYYQIPVADRQALLEEEAEEQIQAEAEAAAEDDDEDESESGASDDANESEEAENDADLELQAEADADAEDEDENTEEDETGDDDGETVTHVLEASELDATVSEEVAAEQDAELRDTDHDEDDDQDDDSDEDEPQAEAQAPSGRSGGRRRRRRRGAKRATDEAENGSAVDSVGSEDALEEVPERVRRRRRTYKIQEVIKRRQIILVQVVKEERGNKGAALTTYLSLAGRYTVLMPNTGRGGGISRKITGPTDRKRLRKIAGELEVPEGMGLIIRTAGASRTKAEVKRDYDYLLRLWENVRDLTLKSSAPALVYEEGNLLKRSIRDLYNKDIDEILVAGEEAHKEAKDFMRMLMPSHAKNVKPYKDPEPIFVRYGVERQLSAMFSPYVTLKSGGYIVINQTEALVAVDVNSGKATREHNIEDTALKTNVEAAEEVARQLRLRDLAGLIVIDFIDMDERRNNRAVERKLKEALRNERARIQVGRISHFGLLEMSRQRLRAGMLEGTTSTCPMCQGAGVVRSTESVSLDVLRSMEDMLITEGMSNLTATAPVDVALYILNQKRHILKDIETRYGITVTVTADEQLHGGNFQLEKAGGPVRAPTVPSLAAAASPVAEDEAEEDAAPVPAESAGEADGDGEAEGGRKRRRRRRRKRGERSETPEPIRATDYMESDPYEDAEELDVETGEAQADDADAQQEAEDKDTQSEAAQGSGRRRRRGRRGGRRSRGEKTGTPELAADAEADDAVSEQQAEGDGAVSAEEPAHEAVAEAEDDEAAKPKRRRRSPREHEVEQANSAESPESAESAEATETTETASNRNGHDAFTVVEDQPQPVSSFDETPPSPAPEWHEPLPPMSEPEHGQAKAEQSDEEEPSSRRRGWWQRRLAGG